ncbi:MAG: sugar phosphate isomerase/epimerase [Lachnospiraceae bacterium]|nr:sugar phosphate isomerase/epimerase [Lachnospiraceae bacterium]
MKQLLIIPDINDLQDSLALAEKYSLGFEYNDFFEPTVLDDEQVLGRIIDSYRAVSLPKYCTMHGAFFDVIPVSRDPKIREVSELRIEQSMEAARRIGAAAVVFHTNYNPFLNTSAYIKSWLKENVAFWSSILERYPKKGIYLENMFDGSPALLEELSEKLCKYPNYGVCLDYAHATISKTAPEVWAERLGRFVKHIHINDNDLVRDLHLAWGNGKINRESFYRCYESYMNGATVLIETSSAVNRWNSLKVLEADGFLK